MRTGDAATPKGRSAAQNLRVFQKWLRADMVSRGYSRVRTKDTWRRGTAATGWLLVERLTSRYRVGDALYFTIGVGVWPIGTWDAELAVSFARHLMPDEPEQGGVLHFAPSDFGASADWLIGGRVPAKPEGLTGQFWDGNLWEVSPGTSFDVAGLESRVAHFLDSVDSATSRLLDPAHALETLLTHRNFRSWLFAAAIMNATGDRGPGFRDVIERLSAMWVADPRPATFRPLLIDLRDRAHLPPITLPDPPVTLS